MSRQGAIPQSLSSLEPSSMQNEESFIVIARSSSPNYNEIPQVPNGSTSAVNSTISQDSPTICGLSSSISLNGLSPDEIQNKLQALVEENGELKEALRQNNLAMKKQFDTLVMWQEEVFKTHQNHKQKFEETKDLVLKLKAEKAELCKLVADLQSAPHSSPDIAQLQAENAALKRKVLEAEAKEKVVCLKEFELKKEIAVLKGQAEELQKKLSQFHEGTYTQGTPTQQRSNIIAAVTAEKEELGGSGTLHYGSTMPSEQEKPMGTSFVMVDENVKRVPGKVEPLSQGPTEEECTIDKSEEYRLILEAKSQIMQEDRKLVELGQMALMDGKMALDVGIKALEESRRTICDMAFGNSFFMVDESLKRLPGKVETRSQRSIDYEETKKQLEECRKVLDVEKLAVEEDRRALEKSRRSMCDKVREAEEMRKKAEMERDNMLMKLAEVQERLQLEKESGKEMQRMLEQRLKDSVPHGFSNWETLQTSGDGEDTSISACQSCLGQIHEYLSSQRQKNFKIEVLIQKLLQIIVSVMDINPSKVKEMKEEVEKLKEQVTGNEKELLQQRSYISEAEQCLVHIKDTMKAKAASISSVQQQSNQADYHEAQARGYRQKLDDITARFTQAEEELRSTRHENTDLTEKLRRMEMEEIPILKTQVDVYLTDFNTEREERERMAAEKQKLEEEVTRLRNQNHLLLEDINKTMMQENRSPPDGTASVAVTGGSGAFSRGNVFNTLAAPGRSSNNTYINQDPDHGEETQDRFARGSSEPKIYTCPKCFKAYFELGPLEVHVNQCLDKP